MYPVQMNPVSSQMHPVSSLMYPVQMNTVLSNAPCELSNVPCPNEPCELSKHPVSSPMYPASCCRGNASRPYLQLECAGRLVCRNMQTSSTQHNTPHNMCLSHSGFIQLRVEMSASCCIKTKHLLSLYTPIRCKNRSIAQLIWHLGT